MLLTVKQKQLAFIQEVLSRVPFLKNLERRFLAGLALTMCEKKITFHSGHLILKKGDIGSSIFVIWSGEAVADQETEDTGATQKLKRGAFLGVTGLMDMQPRTASITAVTDVGFKREVPSSA